MKNQVENLAFYLFCNIENLLGSCYNPFLNKPIFVKQMKFQEVKNRIRDNDSRLTWLKLVNLNLGEVDQLGGILKENKVIKFIDLSKNNIANYALLALSPAFNSIIGLDLSKNNLGDEEVKCIANFLEKNKVLKILDLSNNNITSVGFELILNALKNNTTLNYLNMLNNQVDDSQLTKFCKANNTVKILISPRKVEKMVEMPQPVNSSYIENVCKAAICLTREVIWAINILISDCVEHSKSWRR